MRACAVCGGSFRPSELKKCGPAGEQCVPCYDAHTQRLIAEGGRVSYAKNNVYWGAYDGQSAGLSNARLWADRGDVLAQGLTIEVGKDSGEYIVVILEDAECGFWPMISFLTTDEAAALAGRLAHLAGGCLTMTLERDA